MRRNPFYFSCLAIGLLLFASQAALAAVIFVSDTTGNIWKYDNIADMAQQTSTVNTGKLVGHVDAYATDQDVTMDLTSHLVYRVTGTGDIVKYNNVHDYVFNVNSSPVGNSG